MILLNTKSFFFDGIRSVNNSQFLLKQEINSMITKSQIYLLNKITVAWGFIYASLMLPLVV